MALEDCEDAYGFPPYADLEPFLTRWAGRDLRPDERQIIAAALGDQPTTLIRREARDWWSRIGELYLWNGSQHPNGTHPNGTHPNGSHPNGTTSRSVAAAPESA